MKIGEEEDRKHSATSEDEEEEENSGPGFWTWYLRVTIGLPLLAGFMSLL